MSFFTAIRNWCAGHKKLTVTLLGALVSLIPDKYLTQDQKTALTATLVAYVIGQGVADAGKEKAKIEAAARAAEAQRAIKPA